MTRYVHRLIVSISFQLKDEYVNFNQEFLFKDINKLLGATSFFGKYVDISEDSILTSEIYPVLTNEGTVENDRVYNIFVDNDDRNDLCCYCTKNKLADILSKFIDEDTVVIAPVRFVSEEINWESEYGWLRNKYEAACADKT